ncbi:MAG: L-threonylcarbamoyladenylate synthase [Clostridium sp.]|nr:L-threonylcarbamoyladenylate synthase [Clostridium sp.]
MTTRVIETAGMEQKPEQLKKALALPAGCLGRGGLVAFPTETVYGLGADALNPTAAARIYQAKGRPSDNPLIVHIADVGDMAKISHTNAVAYMLAQAFWPGPLTIILPKKGIVPDETTGGLDTVAIRMPAHPAALELIRQSGVYVAAPSANTSGRPSPTKAEHVLEDMMGKIEYIIDGGSVGIGIESTIVDVCGALPTILRPGFITKKMLEDIVGPVMVDPALEKPAENLRPKAPGMKYTHYAPKGELTLVEEIPAEEYAKEAGETDRTAEAGRLAVTEKICRLAKAKKAAGYRVGVMATKETISCYDMAVDKLVCIGSREKQETVAAGLYAALREFDAAEVEYIYAESFRGDGLAYAIMNRLLRAAGHRVIRV